MAVALSKLSVTFGEMEAEFAELHYIASDKRTSFQARLKHFNRIGIPLGLAQQKGKATRYSPGHLIELALALEFTQLGLAPERVKQVLQFNCYPVHKSIQIAAQALVDQPQGFDILRRDDTSRAADPQSVYLYFDPVALAPLRENDGGEDAASRSLSYGDFAQVRESLELNAFFGRHRLAMINVTALLETVTSEVFPKKSSEHAPWRHSYLNEIITAALESIDYPLKDANDLAIIDFAVKHFLGFRGGITGMIKDISHGSGIPIERVESIIRPKFDPEIVTEEDAKFLHPLFSR